MIGASKILTVSYGTFSCTLEGFDEPFNTMKAIAEYFRDLAAEDRYFGAEPPTPDAAMLHRIAEREVQRRVDASVQDNGVILRAHDAPPAAAAIAAPVAAAPVRAETIVAAEPAPEPVYAAPFAVPAAPAAEIIAEPVPVPARGTILPALNDMPEGVAARLAKIRAAVALTEAAPAAPALSEYVEDQHADEAFAAFDTVEDPVVPEISDVSYRATDDSDDDLIAADEGVAHILADHAAALAEDQSAATAEDDLSAVEDDLPEAAVEDTPLEATYFEADEDLRAALADPIELPVETVALAEEGPTSAAPLLSEDDSELTLEEIADIRAETAAAISDDSADDDLRDLMVLDGALDAPEAEAPAFDDSAYDVSAYDNSADDDMLSRLTAETAPVAETPAEVEALADDDTLLSDIAGAMSPDAAEAADDDLMLQDLDDAPLAAADADTIIFNNDEDMLPEAAMLAEDEADLIEPEVLADDVSDTPQVAEEPAPAPAEPAETAVADKAQRARARIIRVRRSPDIAIVPKAPEPTAEDAAQAALSAEAEAELQRELAALDDAAPDAADFDAELRAQLNSIGATSEAPAAEEQAAPAALDPAVQDESLRRLMDQTQSEMAEPGNKRRLSSIAHLKAAVAATIAERFGSKPKAPEEVEAVRTEPYRNDLARAVRPVRPISGGVTQTERPVERPTPLVLVSEQRIDRPAPVQAPAHVTPVRPRRVSAQAVAVQQAFEDDDFDGEEADDADNIFGDTKGFTDFADRIGATDLPQLLEAAAAYSSAVEGRENFTRPQLLRQIEAVTGSEVSREDELRGFGSLLRDGRIVKVKRGQFALTEASSYLDEARKIAG